MHPENDVKHWQKALTTANKSPRCGATTRKGTPCKAPAMKNGRCRMHGGASTGAPQGCNHPHYKHGLYTKEMIAAKAHFRELMEDYHTLQEYIEKR